MSTLTYWQTLSWGNIYLTKCNAIYRNCIPDHRYFVWIDLNGRIDTAYQITLTPTLFIIKWYIPTVYWLCHMSRNRVHSLLNQSVGNNLDCTWHKGFCSLAIAHRHRVWCTIHYSKKWSERLLHLLRAQFYYTAAWWKPIINYVYVHPSVPYVVRAAMVSGFVRHSIRRHWISSPSAKSLNLSRERPHSNPLSTFTVKRTFNILQTK